MSLRFSRGAVILVDFFEATCVHCLRTLPYLAEWHRRYRDRGLVMVGVHTPEFEASADPAVVERVVREHGLGYPVLLDRERATWRLFANHYWPAKYLADHRGYLRFEHVGEGAYRDTEAMIQRLLREAGDGAPMPPLVEALRPEDAPGAVCVRPTPEVHLGYHRGRLISVEGYRPGEEVDHRGGLAGPLLPGVVAARGRFLHQAEFLESRGGGASLEWICEAAGVYLVVAGDGEAVLEVRRGGEPVPPELAGRDLERRDDRTVVRLGALRMVELIAGGRFRWHHLELRCPASAVRLYALSCTGCVTGPREAPTGVARGSKAPVADR
jgi:thiol-disulfide isomerase/thioredoxin